MLTAPRDIPRDAHSPKGEGPGVAMPVRAAWDGESQPGWRGASGCRGLELDGLKDLGY